LGLSDGAAYDLPRHVRAAVSHEHPTLLVLDNFEQVLDAAPLLAELVTSATALRILITSRAPLRLRGERLYTVEPLGLQKESDTNCPADVARAPAVRLFIERVREAQPEFRVTSANAPTLTAICRRLDALPLALELAAPWMKVLSPEDLLHRLERNPILPDVGTRDLPERQQTMSATVAWSYHLLSSSEQRAFRRFSVLPGLFSIEGASAVLGCCGNAATDDGQALRAVGGLIDKSLLVRVQPSVASTRPMYQMLQTVRTYASLQLESSGERDNASDGLVNYCTSEASRAASGLVGPAQAEWLHRVNEDLDSYRGALTWLIDHDREADAMHIVWSLLFFWFIRGRAAEGLRWFEAILSLPSATILTQSRARTGAAVMCYARGEFDRVRAELREARALTPDTGTDIAAIADLMQGHVERLTGNFVAARERFEDSLKTFESLASPWGIGYARSMMGWLALAAGNEEEAQRLVDTAASALRGSCPWFGTLALYVRAIIAVRQHNPDAAIGFVREGLSLIRRVHDKFAFVHIMVPLAAAAILKGDGAWAARILGARDAVAERSGARIADGLAHELLGTIEREGQKSLGANRWAHAYELGRIASIDSLLNDIESASNRASTGIKI
jgi:predicted ATPase